MEKKKGLTRYSAISVIFIILILLISFKLADIQIVKGQDYRQLAQDKSIRTVDDDAARGKILDRNGIELATNEQSYTIYMMKPQDNQEEKDLNLVIERLIGILNSRNEKINDDFCIIAEPAPESGYSFRFDFPNNYTDETEKQNYIDRAAKQWQKDNGIDESFNAEQTFNYLKENKYHIAPVNKDNDNVPFIRQMMVVRQMIRDKGYMAYKPVEIAYVNRDTAFEIMESSLNLPGVDYKLKPLRKYPYGELASLVLGSLRKVPGGDKALVYKDKHYDVNSDLIGRDGIEAYAEEDLRGEKGGRTVKVDSLGRIVEELGKRDPIPGNNIVLTLDKDLQEVAEKSLDDVMEKLRTGEIKTRTKTYTNATRGAAVVIDVTNGEVLAMASRPGGYDPNDMAATGSISYEIWDKLNPTKKDFPNLDNEQIPKPMFNYATQGAVPPGSTFKMISAIAGLETGQITPTTEIFDSGQYRVVKNFPGNCWIWNYYHQGGHGRVNVTSALKVSCNYFFFDVGRRVGLDNLAKYAQMFGLTKAPTGIEIDERPGDVANPAAAKQKAVTYSVMATLQKISEPGFDPKLGTFVPTKEQEELIKNMIANNDRSYNKLKAAGITSAKIRDRIIEGVRAAYNDYNNQWMALNAAIGQGEDSFTPLQIANYIATIANGGTRYKPHLVKEIVSPNGDVVKEIQPEVLNKLELNSSTLPTVIAGMDAVTGEGGTAGASFAGFQIKTAGKTGTATASGNHDEYSWFAGFAPVDNPKIAVAVVIYEGGGYGSAIVARDIYAHYFKLDIPVTDTTQQTGTTVVQPATP